MSETMLCRREGRLGYMTLNSPESANALSGAMLAELDAAFETFNADPDVRVLVIEGAGNGFSAGYDIKDGAEPDSQINPGLKVVNDVARLDRTVARWLRIWHNPKPVVAVIHGYCMGGALELCMSCDLVVAASDATLQFAAVRSQGVPPLTWYPWFMGLRHAKRFLWTGDPLSGEQAERFDLVNMAVPADALRQTAESLASRVALMPSELLFLNKRALHRALDTAGFSQSLGSGIEADAIAHLLPSAQEFTTRAKRDGLRGAVAWRDAEYQSDRVPEDGKASMSHTEEGR